MRKPALTVGTMTLDFPACRTMRNTLLLFISYPTRVLCWSLNRLTEALLKALTAPHSSSPALSAKLPPRTGLVPAELHLPLLHFEPHVLTQNSLC